MSSISFIIALIALLFSLTQILEERDWQNDSFQDAEKICGVHMQILVAGGKMVDFYENLGCESWWSTSDVGI